MTTNITYLSAVRFAIEKYADADPNEVIFHSDDLGTTADVTNGDVVAKLSALADQLDKRAHALRKPTKKQIASAEARDSIPSVMESGVRYSATDIGKLFGQSSQWAAPKLNALVADGRLTKVTEKGKSFFLLAE